MSVDTDFVGKVTFTRLYAAHFQTFALLAMQYVKDMRVAEDIVQDTFLKYWEAPFTLENPQALKTYFGRIIINRSLNHLKREKNLQRHHELIGKEITEQDVFERLHESELQVMVYGEIERLPEQCKKVFKMNRFEGLRYREIAEQLQLSERTVENHIAHALKVLRKNLLEEKSFKANFEKYRSLLLILGMH